MDRLSLFIAVVLSATLTDSVAAREDWVSSGFPDLGNACDRWDACDANRPRCVGTVGSLFQWSVDPSGGELAGLDEPLVTDRPDFTEASSVVGLGVLQIESGYTYTYNDDAEARINEVQHSYPEMLFRYGMLANWFELRVGFNFGDADVNGVPTAGSEDLYLGAKIGLTPQLGLRPEMAIIPQMLIPLDDGSGEEVSGGLNWLYGWDLNDRFSTAGSTQFNRAVDGESLSGYTEWAQSWTVGYGLTERLSGYTEYFGFYPTGAESEVPLHFVNTGFAYLVGDNVQWDVRYGVGLNDEADDYFVGTGLTVRLPPGWRR